MCINHKTDIAHTHAAAATSGEKHIAALLGSAAHGQHERKTGAMPQASGQAGQRILIKNGHVLTMDDTVKDMDKGDILIEGDKIIAIGHSIDAPDAQVIDATGQIVMPGFIDTHHHQFETALRGSLVNGSLVDDGSPTGHINYLSHILGTLAPQYTPEDVYISELFGSLSQLDAGVTTVFDVSQIHHSPEHSDAAIEALQDAGRRSVFGFFEGAGTHVHPIDDARRIRERYFSSDDQLSTMIMGGEIFLPDWEKAWAVADELDLRIALHVVGSMGLAAPVEALALADKFTDRHLLIHMTGMSDATWNVVSAAGSAVSLAVPIEMTMRHGMPPIIKSQEMNILPSLSSDVECTLTADFFTQMRSTLTLQRGLVHDIGLNGDTSPVPLLTARDVIGYATVGGAKALGLDKRTGSLCVGKAADIILLDAQALNVAPLNNVPGAVVGLMERSNVDTVMVAGSIKKWRGSLVRGDLARLSQAIINSRDLIFNRVGIDASLFE